MHERQREMNPLGNGNVARYHHGNNGYEYYIHSKFRNSIQINTVTSERARVCQRSLVFLGAPEATAKTNTSCLCLYDSC